MSDKPKLFHPCKETCSGYKQGYEDGFDAAIEILRTRRAVFDGHEITDVWMNRLADWLEQQKGL